MDNAGNAALADRLGLLERRTDTLESKEAIRDCLYRINRGMDRIERDLMLSGFHHDAQVCWASPGYVALSEFIEVAMRVQASTSRAQHLLGNILIDLDGDRARVESYEIGRHLTPMGDEKKDLILASRYLDSFSRRDGAWKIERRLKVIDWMRIMEGSDGAWDRAHFKGTRDAADESYRLFGADAFRNA